MARDDEKIPPVHPGESVGQFEIVSILGRGGMGIVYRARDRKLDKEVALKTLWPELAENPDYRRRFLREGKASARLSHPNIVQVFSTFEDKGLPWIALQLIDGKSLRQLLKDKGALSVPLVLSYGVDLAAALLEAHRARVLHRDLSTNNVLISKDGRAILSDFGLARILRPDVLGPAETTLSLSLTEQGAILGTMRYMSPEAARGQETDQRSDIFSLGAVLYEMCTGTPAFTVTGAALLNAIISREPEPISKHSYEIPEELERIIRKAMAKRPDERYQSAEDMRVDLVALKRKEEWKELSGSLPHPAAPRRKLRRGRVVVAVSVLVLAVLALTVGDDVLEFVKRWTGAPTPLPSLDKPLQVTSWEAWEGQPAVSPDGGRVAFASNESGNMDIYVVDVRGGQPLRLTDHPASDREPAWFPDGSALAFESDRSGASAIWKIGQLGGGATLLLEGAAYPDISRDGQWLAFSRSDSSGDLRVGIAPLDDISQARLITTAEDGYWSHHNPTWSPDGRWICYSNQQQLWKKRVNTGRAIPLTGEEARADRDPVWSADGRSVYFSSFREGTLAIWRVGADSRRIQRVTMGTGPESQPSLSNGTSLAYSTNITDHDLILLDFDTGEENAIRGDRDEWMAALSPDKSRLVFVSDRWGPNLDLCVQELRDDRPDGKPKRLTEHEGDASHPAFSPDGHWIAYYRIINGSRDIWILPAEGGYPIQFTNHPAIDLHPAWSPDGTRLAFVSERDGGSTIWVAPVEEGRRTGPPRRITDIGVVALAPSWSPDGKWIAFIGSEKVRYEAWVVPADGSAPARAVTNGAGARRLRWHGPSGDLLVSGTWNRREFELRRVLLKDGTASPTTPRVVFGQETAYGAFDISPDGGLLVFSKESLQGNIWVLQSRQGTF